MSRWIAFGFPLDKFLDYDEQTRLEDVFYKEELKFVPFKGQAEATFVAVSNTIQNLELIDNKEHILSFDSVSEPTENGYDNVYERAKEFGIDVKKVGWYYLSWLS